MPRWFIIDTPVGGYHPDWAILKDDGQATLYLVKETKSTMDFTKLRTPEADKVNCGRRAFEAIGVSFSVVVTGQQVWLRVQLERERLKGDGTSFPTPRSGF